MVFSSTTLPLSQAKQLERKEKELATISSFYKEQLQILEKKVRTIFHLIKYIYIYTLILLEE